MIDGKEIMIEFKVRDDLALNTLKEFFDILIVSVKKGMEFHEVLFSENYHYLGLSLKFNKSYGSASLKLALANDY